MVGGPGACDGHEDPNYAGLSPESTGGYSSIIPGRSAGAGDNGDGARDEQQKHVDKAKARVVTAAKAILKIVMDIVGVTAVLLADGSSKPIEKVELGDLVVATDPETGRRRPRP